ncbi:acyl carrier protein [candidate division GN15 bacterium]|uniref:Acyl carrier protein n=1 Tax=candidate division GN15 bacterium TaxID=2072418 RepID=A0A855XDQ7_9BACT|nr:MAG: acyl carrier protein [candidate division GN15 bacterium]
MTIDQTVLRKELRQFITDSFLIGDDQVVFADTDSFMKNGIIDSTGVLELTAHLEEKYSVTPSDDEMLPANLDSIDNLVNFIQRKLSATAAQ